MVNLMFIEDDEALTQPGIERSLYDATAMRPAEDSGCRFGIVLHGSPLLPGAAETSATLARPYPGSQ